MSLENVQQFLGAAFFDVRDNGKIYGQGSNHLTYHLGEYTGSEVSIMYQEDMEQIICANKLRRTCRETGIKFRETMSDNSAIAMRVRIREVDEVLRRVKGEAH